MGPATAATSEEGIQPHGWIGAASRPVAASASETAITCCRSLARPAEEAIGLAHEGGAALEVRPGPDDPDLTGRCRP